MLIRISVAPASDVSRSGELTACLIASSPLSSPDAIPTPTCASPLFSITVRKSAKSRLISCLIVIRSVIPLTACCNTSSAFFKASGTDVLLSTISRILSLGITISVSTF